ncbi:MAG: spore germination protein GerW family protein [candidate division Zixibacteria bacterium]|nr:spore germination protein GerW family protein [candidate division Zixibacteria bacterium]MDH3936690.1 spore germination protein GerW family protein [candidate division Zixibacteria bacterium]MDH4034141.1 spore germination protein GerW family protein [candidate division Zixibacteria bacterium]
MADNNVVEILKGVVGELKEVARSETIIGDAVTVGDKTVIPIVKISFGFGAGGGQGDDQKRSGFGGGGGGGARIEPAAFIIMDESGVSLLPAGKGKWDTIIDAIPNIAKKISKLKDKFKSEGTTDDDADLYDFDDTDDDPAATDDKGDG